MKKRFSELSDLNSVYEIYMHPKVVPFLGYDPMPKEQFAPIFEGLVKSRRFYVYESNQEIAAFVKVTRYEGRAVHVACLGTLAVNPALQATGLAIKLISELLEELALEGIKRVELFVESDNPKAIRFYEKLGFEKEGLLKKYYKRAGEDKYIDELIMAKLFE